MSYPALIVREDLVVDSYRVVPPIPLSGEYRIVHYNTKWIVQRGGLCLSRGEQQFREKPLATNLTEALEGPFMYPSVESALAALNIYLLTNTGVPRPKGPDYDV